MANHLKNEHSPYLQQHANNPVDWYPWGEEAFKKAQKENKAIFLSIGYSSCHWCHVMEHESFEDKATAKILNKHFKKDFLKINSQSLNHKKYAEKPSFKNYFYFLYKNELLPLK